ILFDVHWARGDIAAAREGTAAALSTYGASPPERFEHADLLAQSAAVDGVYGRHADALAKLERATAIAKRAGTPRGSMLFHLLALREGDARIAVGDARGAKAVLEAQLAAFQADSSFSATRAAVHEGLAEALLDL